MKERRLVRIVGLVGMGAHAARHRGVDRGGDEPRPGTDGLLAAAEPLDIADRLSAGKEHRARDHGGQGIDQVVLGLVGHRRGQQPRRARDRAGEREHLARQAGHPPTPA
jgi:hypothetical protein